MFTEYYRAFVQALNSYWYGFFADLSLLSASIASHIPHHPSECVLESCVPCEAGLLPRYDPQEFAERHCKKHIYDYYSSCYECWLDLKARGILLSMTSKVPHPPFPESRELDQERLPHLKPVCTTHLKQYYNDCVYCAVDLVAVIKAYDEIIAQQKAERLGRQAQSPT
jgi:hypothetical protein